MCGLTKTVYFVKEKAAAPETVQTADQNPFEWSG